MKLNNNGFKAIRKEIIVASLFLMYKYGLQVIHLN